jgi:hypothetical protein
MVERLAEHGFKRDGRLNDLSEQAAATEVSRSAIGDYAREIGEGK